MWDDRRDRLLCRVGIDWTSKVVDEDMSVMDGL